MPEADQALPTLWERHHRLDAWHSETAAKVSDHGTVLARVEGALGFARVASVLFAFLITTLIALAGLAVKRIGDVHDRIETITAPAGR